MQTADFTDLLTGTLPGVDRKHVIKFNNSWLRIKQEGAIGTFYVVYRAMIYKNMPGGAFADPAPVMPGQSGAPWGESWNVVAIGNATIEGCVPENRTGRYFDGVGIAQVQIDFAKPVSSGDGLTVVDDRLIENSDGYEDPRIFTDGTDFFLHSHRDQQDVARGAKRPPARADLEGRKILYEQYRPGVDPELCVKVNKLVFDGSECRLGDEYFYGLDQSQYVEKNFGFFFDEDRLNAVYGLGHVSDGFTLFQSANGEWRGAVNGADIKVNATRLYSMSRRDCFCRIEDWVIHSLWKKEAGVMFSSSGPLVKKTENSWLGVGHVKVAYLVFYQYVRWLAPAAMFLYPGEFNTRQEAFHNLMSDKVFFRNLMQRISERQRQVYETLKLSVILEIAEYRKIIELLHDAPPEFFECDLFKLIGSLLLDENSWVKVDQERKLENPLGENTGKFIIHKNCFYFSFLYELKGKDQNYELSRFSNSFLVTDPQNPGCLQFAENVTPFDGGYVMGFGENDHRAKVAFMTEEELDAMLIHKAGDFEEKNYRFEVISPETQ